MHPVFEYLIEEQACSEGRSYARFMNEDFTDQEIWERCDRPEWMMWLVKKCINPQSFERKDMLNHLVQQVIDTLQADQHTYNLFMHKSPLLHYRSPGSIMLELTYNFGFRSEIVCNAIRQQVPQVLDLIPLFMAVADEEELAKFAQKED